MDLTSEHPKFSRLGVVLKPNAEVNERMGVLNPACARLRDGTLQLYPRMVAPGNISRIGSFRASTQPGGTITFEQEGFALEPQAAYELRSEPGGYGCEDPRVAFVRELDRYVMAYVAFGPRGPEIAIAVSDDGLAWERLGLLRFQESDEPFADKDAAFFPEPVMSPSGVESLAFYHRPTLKISVQNGQAAAAQLESLPRTEREGLAIGYIPLAEAKADINALCTVAETHRVELPPGNWGKVKVGGGTPPVRIAEGWLAVIHGVDPLPEAVGTKPLRYCAGVVIHDAVHLDQIVYRSPEPLFIPQQPAELYGTVGHVVFPTGIDCLGERQFDIYYGMADYEIGRGSLTLPKQEYVMMSDQHSHSHKHADGTEHAHEHEHGDHEHGHEHGGLQHPEHREGSEDRKVVEGEHHG
jgi:beta-1,2-mannobiose phosphorylase / 1,2-beta-oligomannan phosphorylase